MTQNALDALRQLSTVVADTGDVEAIRRYRPTDATTNPSLLLQVATSDDGERRLTDAVSAAYDRHGAAATTQDALDAMLIAVGSEIVSIVPRYVSTEVDARLSFDTEATIRRALDIIELYDRQGVSSDRILIKIASTWEGIQAASVLESRGIRCNMTLMFSLAQAMACADAGVTLISPFVGRIFDWHCRAEQRDTYPAEQDPGVLSVKRIYRYLKQNRYETEVMAASFRNSGEILALAGCDLLTIAPKFLDALEQMPGPVTAALVATVQPESGDNASDLPDRHVVAEAEFRLAMNEDAMANDLLADGIRRFAADQVKLETLLASQLVDRLGNPVANRPADGRVSGSGVDNVNQEVVARN